MVSQETTLFDDTIKNNIKYARENASDDEIYHVANLSFCEEFINNLPNKYETLIGENGVRLSGGEKQRLSIARAMLKKSSIILLDEATSSLDSETETKIQEAINILTKNKTTIVIAHQIINNFKFK
jgi:subfamily B ATP-binding cassette protein MsbA